MANLIMTRVYGTPMGDPSDFATLRSTMEPHDSLKNSNAKSLPSALDKISLSPGNNFRSSSTLTTSQPSQLDLQSDASNSSYCEECFYCPECSDHSDCESCVDCETCIECDDCDITMERTRRYTAGMMGELDGMMHYTNTTSSNNALLQHSGDDGWMDFVNIPQDADVTGDQNSATNDAQGASTTVQTGLPVLDDISPSNFSTGFPTTEGYTEETCITTTEYCLVADPHIELRIVNPSDLFGVGQQFDGIPSNYYGDKASISESPTLAVDDDALFRRIFQAAGIMSAAAVGDAEMPAMHSPLSAYPPAQAMPVAYPTDNFLAPTVDTYKGFVPQDAIGDNAYSEQRRPYRPGAVRDPYAENPYATNLATDFLAATTSSPPPPPPPPPSPPTPPGFAFQAAPSTISSGPSDTMVVRNIYTRTIMVANPLNNTHRPTATTRPAARLARRKKTPDNCPLAKKTCPYCPDKGPFDASGLAKHNNSLEHQKARGAVIPTKKYACPYCKKRFPRQDHIKRHILKVIKAANDSNVVVPPKCPVLRKKDADGEQGVWEWELEANGSHALLKDRNERNPFMMPIGYKARMKQTYGGRHGQ